MNLISCSSSDTFLLDVFRSLGVSELYPYFGVVEKSLAAGVFHSSGFFAFETHGNHELFENSGGAFLS